MNATKTKKVFTMLGVLFAVILAVIIVAAAIFIPRTLKLDRAARAYIQEEIPKIVANWKSQELVDRGTPEFLAAGDSRDKIDTLFKMFQRLGPLKHLDEPTGVVTTSTYTGTGTVTIGNYKAEAEFEKGKARIEIQLRRVDDSWKINGFYIFSDALIIPKA